MDEDDLYYPEDSSPAVTPVQELIALARANEEITDKKMKAFLVAAAMHLVHSMATSTTPVSLIAPTTLTKQ